MRGHAQVDKRVNDIRGANIKRARSADVTLA